MKINGLRLVVLALVVCFGATAFSADYFDPLFCTAKVKGNVYVLRPGETKPVLAKEKYRYPYGSKVIVEGINPKLSKDVVQKNEVMLIFANDYQIRLGMDTVVTTEKTTVDGNAKVTVGIEKGTVSTFITLSTSQIGDEVEDKKIKAKLNAFSIKTAIAEVSQLVERNEIRVSTDSKGLVKSKYKIESGSINLDGQQFKIVSTRRKTAFDIIGDAEYTRIMVNTGDITASLSRGEDTPYKSKFKQGTQVKLWRIYTQLQKKLAVAVMIIFPDGKSERFEYLENPSKILNSLQGRGEELGSTDDVESDESFDDESLDNTSEDGFEDQTPITDDSSATDESSSSEESLNDDFFGDDFSFDSDEFDMF